MTRALFLLFVCSLANADFREVNPRHSSQGFRDYVEAALHALENSKSELGRETFESVTHGKVRIDEIADLTRHDYLRILSDYRDAGDALPLTRDDYGTPKAARVLSDSLNGYQWEDRIYVSAGQSPRKLAATLVHEVNHVLNESHIHYYESHRAALIEEYRAFWLESAFRGADVEDPGFCRRLKLKVAKLYSLDDVDVDSIPDHPPGKLVPGASAW